MSNVYKIIESFPVGDTKFSVLVLDRDYEYSPPAKDGIAIIEEKKYKFNLNSIPRWATIDSLGNFEGKTVTFI